MNEGDVGGAAGQPQDQLVTKQHQGVVSQGLRVLGDGGQTIVEGNVVLAVLADRTLESGKNCLDERGD